MINLANPGIGGGSPVTVNRVFNSSPIELRNTGVDALEQVSYDKFKGHTNMDLSHFVNALKKSNPTLNFGILNDPDFVNETSELINKPDEEIWKVNCGSDGCFIIQK